MMMKMMMAPMVVTLVGIVTDFNDEHDWNAYAPNDKFRVTVHIEQYIC